MTCQPNISIRMISASCVDSGGVSTCCWLELQRRFGNVNGWFQRVGVGEGLANEKPDVSRNTWPLGIASRSSTFQLHQPLLSLWCLCPLLLRRDVWSTAYARRLSRHVCKYFTESILRWAFALLWFVRILQRSGSSANCHHEPRYCVMSLESAFL